MPHWAIAAMPKIDGNDDDDYDDVDDGGGSECVPHWAIAALGIPLCTVRSGHQLE